MTDVRKMRAFRDVQVAEDFREMASQGYIDTEFTIYGCTYWKNQKRHYLVSSEEKKIVEFIKDSKKKDLYPTKMLSLTKVCPVPQGQKEDIAQELKKQLAKKMQAVYPESFFQLLEEFTEHTGNNEALPVLEQLKQELAYCFSEERLHVFEELIYFAYERKNITKNTYLAIQDWLDEERMNMADDVVMKDLYERTFYGFVYENQPNKLKYVINARQEKVESKRITLLNEGKKVSPVFTKTYWYNHNFRLIDVQQHYEKHLQEVFNQTYFNIVNTIYACPSAIDKRHFDEKMSLIKQNLSPEAYETIISYGIKWGIAVYHFNQN